MLAAGSPHTVTQVVVVEQCQQALGDVGGVALDVDATFSVVEDFRHTLGARCHHRRLAGEGLCQAKPEALGHARHDTDIRAGIEGRHMLTGDDPTGKAYPVRHLLQLYDPEQMFIVRIRQTQLVTDAAVAGDQQRRIGAQAADQLKSVQ